MKFTAFIYEFIKTVIILYSAIHYNGSEILLALIPLSVIFQIIILSTLILKKNNSSDVDTIIQIKKMPVELYFVIKDKKLYYVSDQSSISSMSFKKIIAWECIYSSNSKVVQAGINSYLRIIGIVIFVMTTIILLVMSKISAIVVVSLYLCLLIFSVLVLNDKLYKYNVAKRGKQYYNINGKNVEIEKEQYDYLITVYPELKVVNFYNTYYNLISVGSKNSNILFQSKNKSIVEAIKRSVVSDVEFKA